MLVRFYFVLAVASARMIDINFPECIALISTVSSFAQLNAAVLSAVLLDNRTAQQCALALPNLQGLFMQPRDGSHGCNFSCLMRKH